MIKNDMLVIRSDETDSREHRVVMEDNAHSQTTNREEHVALPLNDVRSDTEKESQSLKLKPTTSSSLSVPGQHARRKSSGHIAQALGDMAERLNGNDEMSRRPTAGELDLVAAGPRKRSLPDRLMHSTILPIRHP